jgi:hypothetical protein
MKIESMVCCILLACDESPAPRAACPAGVLVATSDYGTASEVGVLPLDGAPAVLVPSLLLGADPALASSAGRHFFIERDDDENIYEIDKCGYAIATYASADPSENQTDPQDVAVASDGSLWVARLFSGAALVIGTTRSEVDLSSADADGIPNMSAVRIANGRAFIALDRLDDHDPNLVAKQPAAMAVVDVATHTLERVVELPARNPIGAMPQIGDTLWLATAGDIELDHEQDAGIVTFSTATLESALLVPESAIGGSVSAVVIDDHCGVAIAFDAVPNVNHTFLIAFDTSGVIVQATAFRPTLGFDLAGLVWSNGKLIVGDRRLVDGAYAVHTFTRDATCMLTQSDDLALPMAPVAFLAQ